MKAWRKSFVPRTLLVGATLAAALALGACGGGSTSSQSTATPTATGSATVALAASAYTIAAGASTIVVTADIARTGTGSGAVSVSYATADGDAHAGTDYQAASGALDWAAGDTASKTISITVLPGATAARSFTVQLGTATGASLGQPAAASVKLPTSASGGGGSGTATLALAANAYTVATGATSAQVTVQLVRTGTGTGAVSVHYATVNGTALAGTDFTATSGTLNWSATDSASKTVSIAELPAATGGRSLTLQLSAASGASLGQPASAVVTLAAGTGTGGSGTATLSLASSAYSVTPGAGSAVVAVRLVRTGTGSGAVSVQYATANGTAVAGTDYTATSGTLSWSATDSASKSVSIVLLPGATAGRSFTLQLASATGGTLAQPSSAVVSLVAPGAGLKIISRGVPAFASSGTASQGNDGNYSHTWRSSGLPATLAYDLSAISPAPSAVLLAWYNESSYSFDHSLIGQVGYNNAGSYTIEVNAAAGGGSAPTSGWQVAATVTGNTLHSRQHYLQFAGFHWIRINATASDGSAGNMDVNIKMDVYDASNGVGDGWFFGGDSITANCMGHGSQGGGAYDSFGNEVAASKGIVPPQENAGMGGWDTLTYGQHIAAWLAGTSSKYVTLNLGTNDAAGGIAPAMFYTRMESLVKAVIAAGKVPVLPTIPWSPEPTHSANTPGLNAQIKALYTSYPQVIHGPDLYAFFQTYPNYISSDNIHPTAAGCAALRSQWAQFAASSVY